MNQGVRGRANACAVEHTVPVRKPGYATHLTVSPSRREALLPPTCCFCLADLLVPNKNRSDPVWLL